MRSVSREKMERGSMKMKRDNWARTGWEMGEEPVGVKSSDEGLLHENEGEKPMRV
jgi:hypothetical protein